jgi:hypothetical protein
MKAALQELGSTASAQGVAKPRDVRKRLQGASRGVDWPAKPACGVAGPGLSDMRARCARQNAMPALQTARLTAPNTLSFVAHDVKIFALNHFLAACTCGLR